MDEARRIREEIARLEAALADCQKRLFLLQKTCHHQFNETALNRTCVKCLLTESLYY